MNLQAQNERLKVLLEKAYWEMHAAGIPTTPLQHEIYAEINRKDDMPPELEEFLTDIIVTAVEGGINYWANVEKYKHTPNAEASAIIHLNEDDVEGFPTEGKPINIQIIKSAIDKIVSSTPDDIGVHSSYINNIRNAYAQRDAGMLDASDADNIVQVAVLDKVIYG